MVDVARAESVGPTHSNRRKFPRFNESIHRHGGDSHQLCYLCDCHEVSTLVGLTHGWMPLLRLQNRPYSLSRRTQMGGPEIALVCVTPQFLTRGPSGLAQFDRPLDGRIHDLADQSDEVRVGKHREARSGRTTR